MNEKNEMVEEVVQTINDSVDNENLEQNVKDETVKVKKKKEKSMKKLCVM